MFGCCGHIQKDTEKIQTPKFFKYFQLTNQTAELDLLADRLSPTEYDNHAVYGEKSKIFHFVTATNSVKKSGQS